MPFVNVLKILSSLSPRLKPLISTTSVLYVIIGVYVNVCQNLLLTLLSKYFYINIIRNGIPRVGGIIQTSDLYYSFIVVLCKSYVTSTGQYISSWQVIFGI